MMFGFSAIQILHLEQGPTEVHGETYTLYRSQKSHLNFFKNENVPQKYISNFVPKGFV